MRLLQTSPKKKSKTKLIISSSNPTIVVYRNKNIVKSNADCKSPTSRPPALFDMGGKLNSPGRSTEPALLKQTPVADLSPYLSLLGDFIFFAWNVVILVYLLDSTLLYIVPQRIAFD